MANKKEEKKETESVVESDNGFGKRTVKGKEEKVKIIPKDVDLNQTITVLNGFQGRLIYISPRTGERFVWDEFGAEQDLELRELRNAKSSAKQFFENNWFMFKEEDAWVIDFLGVSRMYKNSINVDEFDTVFSHKPEYIKKVISSMPDGQKNSLAYRARQLVIDKEIDSLSVITALEEALGIELIER